MRPSQLLQSLYFLQPDYSVDITVSTAEMVKLFSHQKKVMMVYVVKGELEVTAQGSLLKLRTGDLLLNPVIGTTFLSKGNGEPKFLVATFSETWLKKFELDTPEANIAGTYQSPLISNLFKQIKHEMRVNDERSAVLISSFFVQLFSYILRNGLNQVNKEPDWVAAIKNLIDENYQQKLTLTDIAKEAGMHPVYLSSQFERYFSVSFIRYLKAVRIEKAVLLLKQKNKSIAEIAYLCGFADQSHFQRSFKNMFGVSPGYYSHMQQISK